jgi:hypothetical protein
MTRWNDPDAPEYDLEADMLIYRDSDGNETRREKFEDGKAKESPKGSPHPPRAVRNADPLEKNIHPLQRIHRNRGGVEEFFQNVW